LDTFSSRKKYLDPSAVKIRGKPEHRDKGKLANLHENIFRIPCDISHLVANNIANDKKTNATV
jgi:hypothetical protein